MPRWVAERSLPGRRLFVAVPLPPPSCVAVERLVGDVRRAVREALDGRDAMGPGPGAGSGAGAGAGAGVGAGVGAGAPRREVRWVRLDGLHLTLRFLGPTLDERIPAIETAMRGAAEGVAPFTVAIAGGGAFPSPVRPRILWLGVTDGAGNLGSLAQRLGDGLAGAGWERDDRPFRPHLTLARSDGIPAGSATAAALMDAAGSFGTSWIADRLVLFESHTGGGPARYEALREVALAG